VKILNRIQVKFVGSVEHHVRGGGDLVRWHWTEVGGHLHAAAVLPPERASGSNCVVPRACLNALVG